MQFEYDTDAQALDISFTNDAVVRTVEIDAGTLVDLAADGTVVAIEVIQPARQWPLPEILEQYDVPQEASAMLLALWPQGGTGSFAFPQTTNAVAVTG